MLNGDTSGPDERGISDKSLLSSGSKTIPVAHRLVVRRGPYIGWRKCCECKKYLLYFLVKKESIYVCEVCGIRVHDGCVNRLMNNCIITTKFVGGLVHNAIKKWEVTAPTSSGTAMSSTSQEVPGKNVYNICEENEEERLMTWEDVTIQPKDIIVKDVIGNGLFGRVHIGIYHGDVAVKYVHLDDIDKTKRFQMFKTEIVTAYKNSRHNNIALFLGFFADVPTNTFAIVTNFYHGNNLYHRIHENSEEYDYNWCLNISLQICQAMSYLHKKFILHKDLRSKNILLDKFNKVFVSDFALFRFERIVQKNDKSIRLPSNWVDYVAPELVSCMFVNNGRFVPNELHFTHETDVFAFGTIFYELLMRRMPCEKLPWEIRVYEKIIGMKGTLNKFETASLSRCNSHIAQTLMKCWNYDPERRPSFATVVKDLTDSLKRKDSSSRHSIRCFESAF